MPSEVTISYERYEIMKKRLAWLSALEQAGVDNWDGCDYAREIYAESHPDDEDEEED